MRQLGGDVALVPANLADAETAAPLFDAVEAHLGPVDVLINNAAHCERPDSVLESTAGSLDRTFAVNARTPSLLMREFAARYKARGGSQGRIVNVSTDAARAFATQIGYGASQNMRWKGSLGARP